MKVFVLVVMLFGIALARFQRAVEDPAEPKVNCDEVVGFVEYMADELVKTMPVLPLPEDYEPLKCIPPPLLHYIIGLTSVVDAFRDNVTYEETLCITEYIRDRAFYVIEARREYGRLVIPDYCPSLESMQVHLPMDVRRRCPELMHSVIINLATLVGEDPTTIGPIEDVMGGIVQFLLSMSTPELCAFKMWQNILELSLHIGSLHIDHSIASTNADQMPDEISGLICFTKFINAKINNITKGECVSPRAPFCNHPLNPPPPPPPSDNNAMNIGSYGIKKPKFERSTFLRTLHKKTLDAHKKNLKNYLGL